MTIKTNKKTVGLYALCCALISQAAFAAQPLVRAGDFAVNTGANAVNTGAGMVGDVTDPVLGTGMNTVDGNMNRRNNRRSRAAMEMDNSVNGQLACEPKTKRCCTTKRVCEPATELREVCKKVRDVPREVCHTVYDERTVTELKEFPTSVCKEVETCTDTTVTQTQTERPCPPKPCKVKCEKPCKVRCAKPKCERPVRGCSTGACSLR